MKEQAVKVDELVVFLRGVIFHLNADGSADERAFRNEAISLRDRLKAYGNEGA